MKKILGLLLITMLTLTSCTSVDTGHEAPIISYGGQTDMTHTLTEGQHWGLDLLLASTPEYEVRERTFTIEEKYNDKNDMETPIRVTIYFKPITGKTNYLHKYVGEDYVERKLHPMLLGALSKVVPSYSAQDLNKTKKVEGQAVLTEMLKKETPSIYVETVRVEFTYVGIPPDVAEKAKQIAVQESKNMLASKKEAEQVALAKAKVAEAQGNYDAGILNAKTKDIMSSPKMLELFKMENERIMWEGFRKHGQSPFGENNIFGSGDPKLILNRK